MSLNALTKEELIELVEIRGEGLELYRQTKDLHEKLEH